MVNGTSTGIWADDSVNLTANLTRYLVDGYFTTNSDYESTVFVQNNPSAYEQAGVYKLDAGNEVDDASWLIGGSLTAASKNYNQDTNELKVEGTLTMQGVASGSNTFDLNVHYADSTVTPIKSGGAPSSVTVPAGVITLTGAFNASVDKDVDPRVPNVSITDVFLYGEPHAYGDTDVSGYITYQLRDGYFEPGSGYTPGIFDNNNPSAYEQGGLHKLDASCLPFTIYGKVNGTNFNSLTPIFSNHVYSGTIYFNGITLTGTNTFKVLVEYSNSTVTANKLSNRPSSKCITAGTASCSSTKSYTAPVQEYHFYILSSSEGSNQSFNYVTDILENVFDYSTVGFNIANPHVHETSTNKPNTYTATVSSDGNTIGKKYKTIIAIAPSDYIHVDLYTDDNEHTFDSVTPVTVPYSASDSTQYNVFVDSDGGKNGYYPVSEIKYKKS